MQYSILILCSVAVLVLLGILLFVLYYFGALERIHTKPKPKDGQIRIACVGDSITHGCMLKNRAKNNYPKQLQNLLGEKYCVGNFGYTNRTAVFDGDYPYVQETIYQQSLAFEPNIVLLLLGTNDSKANNWNADSYADAMRKIVESYVSLPCAPTVWLLTPPPAFPVGKKVLYAIRPEIIDSEIYPLTLSLAQEMHLPIIDIHKVFSAKKHLFADGVHPNKDGAELFAKTVKDALCKQ